MTREGCRGQCDGAMMARWDMKGSAKPVQLAASGMLSVNEA